MFTKEDVLKIAKLAKLSLNEEEIKTFPAQFSDILNYVEQLNELDTTGIPPTARAIPSSNAFRDDVVHPGIDLEDALKNAPERENNMFKVPKI